jgi:hypothetical protein
VITVTLSCTASSNRTCHTTVTVSERGHRLGQKTVTFRGGSTKRVQLRIRASAIEAAARHLRTVALTITASTGSYRSSKTLR